MKSVKLKLQTQDGHVEIDFKGDTAVALVAIAWVMNHGDFPAIVWSTNDNPPFVDHPMKDIVNFTLEVKGLDTK